MQLNKLSLILLTSITGLVPILNANSSDEVKLTQMKYFENKDRMKVDFSVLDIKKDFGTDYSLNASLSYDTMSGGTPIWDSISSASLKATGISSDERCKTNTNLCQNTLNKTDLLSDGQKDMSQYKYKNVQINDKRTSLSLNLIKRTPKRDEMSLGFAYSTEEDFKSTELSTSYLYYIDEYKNNSISLGLSIQNNKVLHRRENNIWKEFDILNFQLGYSRVFTKNLVSQANIFVSKQSGSLSNPYQTIIRYFDITNLDSPSDTVNNYFIAKEKRPTERISTGFSLDLAYKIKKNISVHTSYRFYEDDWGILSNTLSFNSYIEVYPKLTIIPLIRYYNQKAANFYKAHDSKDFHFSEGSYGTSDERMGGYTGITLSLGIEYKIKDNIDINFIFAKQKQSFGLKMNWSSIGIKYAF